MNNNWIGLTSYTERNEWMNERNENVFNKILMLKLIITHDSSVTSFTQPNVTQCNNK